MVIFQFAFCWFTIDLLVLMGLDHVWGTLHDTVVTPAYRLPLWLRSKQPGHRSNASSGKRCGDGMVLLMKKGK
jgi:hypothetical protein